MPHKITVKKYNLGPRHRCILDSKREKERFGILSFILVTVSTSQKGKRKVSFRKFTIKEGSLAAFKIPKCKQPSRKPKQPFKKGKGKSCLDREERKDNWRSILIIKTPMKLRL
jgi:hypothetical protein